MSNWKPGPLPKGTYNWGGVVVKGDDPAVGFYFADFHGDHVLLCPDGRRVEPADVAFFNNCLDMPPGGVTTRAGA